MLIKEGNVQDGSNQHAGKTVSIYEKQSLAAFWKTSMLAEKIFLVCWSINAVLMAIIFAVLTPMATDRGTAIFIFYFGLGAYISGSFMDFT